MTSWAWLVMTLYDYGNTDGLMQVMLLKATKVQRTLDRSSFQSPDWTPDLPSDLPINKVSRRRNKFVSVTFSSSNPQLVSWSPHWDYDWNPDLPNRDPNCLINLLNKRDRNKHRAIDLQISWTSGDSREWRKQHQSSLHWISRSISQSISCSISDLPRDLPICRDTRGDKHYFTIVKRQTPFHHS